MIIKVRRNERELHGWEKAMAVVLMLWGLIIVPITFPIWIVTGRWPFAITRISYGP